jgi:lipid A disaccharide synthetase
LSLFIYRMLQTKEQREKTIISGLPNIIMGREFVPEMKQEKFTAANIVKELRQILTDSKYNADLRKDLQVVKGMIGPKGVMARAAQEIIKLIDSEPLTK